MNSTNPNFRIERDPLGEVQVPCESLFGVQTARALENFRISTLRIHPLLITAFAEIKKAAALANLQVGKLAQEKAAVIIGAAEEIIAGLHGENFALDVFQSGAGTSYNMNVNEVIANRALELLGAERGDYARINPNDDVNKAQSTNDTMPTAMRTAGVRLLRDLVVVLDELAGSFAEKAVEFAEVRKSGRTHLHDATEMTLGEEFGGYADNLKRAIARLRAAEGPLLEVPLGGTAVGTGVNTHRDYARLAVAELSRVTGLALREAPNRFQSQQSLGDFLALSSALRGFAVEMSKIANDLRLLSSGPHTALDEIGLPAVQPGSSIMPGKVNPALPEMMNMVCFHIIGHDTAVMMCAESEQLELNVTMPYVAYALFESMQVMTNAARALDEKCVQGITANLERCREYADKSVGKAATLNEKLGFLGAAELAKRAIDTGKSIDELLAEGEAEKAKEKISRQQQETEKRPETR